MTREPQDAFGVAIIRQHPAGGPPLFCPLMRLFLSFTCLGNYVLRAHNLESESHLAITY